MGGRWGLRAAWPHGGSGVPLTRQLRGVGQRGGRWAQGAGTAHPPLSSEAALQVTLQPLIWCSHAPNRLDYPQKHLQMMFLEPLSIEAAQSSERGCSLLTPARGVHIQQGRGAQLPCRLPTWVSEDTVSVNPGGSPSPGSRGPPAPPWLPLPACPLLGPGPWGRSALGPLPSCGLRARTWVPSAANHLGAGGQVKSCTACDGVRCACTPARARGPRGHRPTRPCLPSILTQVAEPPETRQLGLGAPLPPCSPGHRPPYINELLAPLGQMQNLS